MSAVADILKQIAGLGRAEQEEVYLRLTRPSDPQAYPGIRKTVGVCGGSACVRDFRLPVWSLESYRRLGMTDAQLLALYPFVTADDLAHAWAYVAGNRDEIDAEVRRNEGG